MGKKLKKKYSACGKTEKCIQYGKNDEKCIQHGKKMKKLFSMEKK